MGWWGLLVLVAPLAVAVVRELMTLRRDAARRASIERLVTIARTGVRITDRTCDGAVIEIVVDRASTARGQAVHRHDQPPS